MSVTRRGGMTFGAPIMGPAQVRATHFWYSGESPYFSSCFFSSPAAASPARTPKMPKAPRALHASAATCFETGAAAEIAAAKERSQPSTSNV